MTVSISRVSIGLVGHVAGDGVDRAVELGLERLQALRPASREHRPRAARDQRARQLLAETGARAGDQDDESVEAVRP